MIYSALIRRLVQASIEAKLGRYDVADRLADRCLPETSLIRRVLMNAVCDPRFKIHVAAVPDWRKMATEVLENLAWLLTDVDDLCDELAEDLLDDFLNEWLMAMLDAQERKELEYTMPEKVASCEKDIMNAISGFSIEDDSSTGDDKKDSENADDEESENSEDEDIPSGSSDLDFKKEGSPTYGRGSGPERERLIDNSYLEKIPPTLVALAKKIGRSGSNNSIATGSFPSATKCDIAGVSVGDDLGSVLPVELALLSERSTQNLFFKNYVTKKLQVFSSVSKGEKGKRRDDGPIIVCLDTSGSMEGTPILIAKAITIAVCIIAQRKKREVLVVKYSDHHYLYKLTNMHKQRKELLQYLSSCSMGGNNEEWLFSWLLNEVIPNEPNFQSADLLCVSDFGWGSISQEVIDRINEEKKKDVRIYGLNISNDNTGTNFLAMHVDDFYPEGGSPVNICDSLWEYSNGVCKERKAKNENTNHQPVLRAKRLSWRH